MRSWPAGGSFAYVAHGVASAHAMYCGYVLEMTDVCPGVSISCGGDYLFSTREHPVISEKATYDENVNSALFWMGDIRLSSEMRETVGGGHALHQRKLRCPRRHWVYRPTMRCKRHFGRCL